MFHHAISRVAVRTQRWSADICLLPLVASCAVSEPVRPLGGTSKEHAKGKLMSMTRSISRKTAIEAAAGLPASCFLGHGDRLGCRLR